MTSTILQCNKSLLLQPIATQMDDDKWCAEHFDPEQESERHRQEMLRDASERYLDSWPCTQPLSPQHLRFLHCAVIVARLHKIYSKHYLTTCTFVKVNSHLDCRLLLFSVRLDAKLEFQVYAARRNTDSINTTSGHFCRHTSLACLEHDSAQTDYVLHVDFWHSGGFESRSVIEIDCCGVATKDHYIEKTTHSAKKVISARIMRLTRESIGP